MASCHGSGADAGASAYTQAVALSWEAHQGLRSAWFF